MKKNRGFYFPAFLLLGVALCTVFALTAGKSFRPLVEPVQAEKDYLMFQTEMEGVLLDERRGEEQLVEADCDFKQAREILGAGSQVEGSFLELIQGTSTVMEENVYYGRLVSWEPKGGRYKILLGFPVELPDGLPVQLLVGRREGPYPVIPKSAVAEDEEGTYVMEIITEDSMWGETDCVRRVPVTVEKVSGYKAAVSGLSMNDSRPDDRQRLVRKIDGLADGDVVRVGEKQR